MKTYFLNFPSNSYPFVMDHFHNIFVLSKHLKTYNFDKKVKQQCVQCCFVHQKHTRTQGEGLTSRQVYSSSNPQHNVALASY